MSDSIYAPPEADVSAPPIEEGTRYYVVAPSKFVLLSIFTFTFYFVYWFYRNWKQIKERDGADHWPVARAIFYIFFTHSLFTDIDIRVKERDENYRWQPVLLATLFVVLTVTANIVDRVLPDEWISAWLLLGTFGLLFVLIGILLSAQKAINFACDDVGGTQNNKLTAANFAWMALGVLWWIVALIGLYATFNPEFLTTP